MGVSRRSFVKLLALLGSLPALWRSPAAQSKQQAPLPETTLKALIDTLVPADETPGAVELGIPGLLLKTLQRAPQHQALVQQGCQWLDRQARQLGAVSFAGLNAGQREAVLQQLEKLPADTIELRFFHSTRFFVFKHYYGDPRIWSSLSYPGPPQPRGFMNYQQSPAKQHDKSKL
jgi:hypothetical protein